MEISTIDMIFFPGGTNIFAFSGGGGDKAKGASASVDTPMTIEKFLYKKLTSFLIHEDERTLPFCTLDK